MLRRWDGAHTGPHGARHGLYNLLRTARARRTPLFLLDLKAPISLAAIEASTRLEMVQHMAAASLLSLPDVQLIPYELPNSSTGELAALAAAFSRSTALAYDLPASVILYTSREAPLPPAYRRLYRAVFSREQTDLPSCPGQPAALQRVRKGSQLIYLIKGCTDPEQVSPGGLSLATRRALLSVARQTDESDTPDVLLLGGDLAQSPWGEPASARAAFRYLASRPWVQVLDEHHLLSLPIPSGEPAASKIAREHPLVLPESYTPTQLQPLLREPLAALFGPISPFPAALPDLRAAYLGQTGLLVFAERWNIHPEELAGCSLDLDADGHTECVLSSQTVLALFETLRGSLTHLFVRQEGQLHQLVAPSSQFAVGLSLPDGWNIDGGRPADPAVLPGAFAFPVGEVLTRLDGGVFTVTGDGGAHRYSLLPDGLLVSFNTPQDRIQLPLALDPWQQFNPGWSKTYEAEAVPGGWVWRLADGPSVLVRSQAEMQIDSFVDSGKFMGEPENPNRDYPPGHLLPFPMAVMQLSSSDPFTLTLRLQPH